MMNDRTYGAWDLLALFLELKGLTPDLGSWTETALKDNPPRLYRLQQLKALFQVFGIPWELEAFLKGDFIQFEDARYEPLLQELWQDLRGGEDGACRQKKQLQPYFEMLFQYRMCVEHIFSFASDVLCASGLYRKAYFQAANVNRIIRKEIADIERILSTLVDPADRDFTKAQLVRDYAFPDVDLQKLDLDWT
jgi:hypothetical protein